MRPDRIIRDKECEAKTGLAKNTRRMMEKAGTFPRRRQITERVFGYSEREVDEWVTRKLHGDERVYAEDSNLAGKPVVPPRTTAA